MPINLGLAMMPSKQSVQVHGAEETIYPRFDIWPRKQSVQVHGAEAFQTDNIIKRLGSNLYKCTEQKEIVKSLIDALDEAICTSARSRSDTN